MQVLSVGQKFPIAPADIRPHPTQPFTGVFGKTEAEALAGAIIAHCQKLGGWIPFPLPEVLQYGAFRLLPQGLPAGVNRLTQLKLIVVRDGLVYVTAEFVNECFSSAPAKQR